MANYYIKKNKVINFTTDLTGIVEVSNDFEKRNTTHVALSEKQIEFYEANKTASVHEVWNMQLNAIEQAEAIEPTSEQLRHTAYAMENIINWQGEMITCDVALLRLSKYRELDDSRHSELQQLYKNAVNEIKNRYS